MKKVYTDYIGNGNCCYFPELVKTNSFYKAMYENQTQNNDDFDIGE